MHLVIAKLLPQQENMSETGAGTPGTYLSNTVSETITLTFRKRY